MEERLNRKVSYRHGTYLIIGFDLLHLYNFMPLDHTNTVSRYSMFDHVQMFTVQMKNTVYIKFVMKLLKL